MFKYVLQPKLQDGKKLPKWVPRTRRGQYLGSSTNHASTIAQIRNLVTGHVSPQFHVVYEPWFNTVPNTGEAELDKVDKVDFRKQNFPEDFDNIGNVLPPPTLVDDGRMAHFP
jgi:hypothetical protein